MKRILLVFLAAAFALSLALAQDKPVRLGGNVAQANLLSRVTPVYPGRSEGESNSRYGQARNYHRQRRARREPVNYRRTHRTDYVGDRSSPAVGLQADAAERRAGKRADDGGRKLHAVAISRRRSRSAACHDAVNRQELRTQPYLRASRAARRACWEATPPGDQRLTADAEPAS